MTVVTEILQQNPFLKFPHMGNESVINILLNFITDDLT